ncbi:MAG: hypothetical protein COW00_09825 [Bdellovibrio sp. CG12_big_fil_rev_8_21_14_0_65_39_13]|nr:MAG: hypothetical protein COW78_15870 [Bdellovibrio sp. CG22_combo_CG10-13_8_21_14_all_39_27]PIQ59598.1 MAG: hypothetical protein COW00_09825 [Bdellovibrio sp. CG12_big_fil_rev_8_21_14_0_65_39_13]PIR33166.1 MAG: hypothetical protein COV37_17120 [Bdellovibrio sp. CG11_big_fil_rev_8_21_14_0_20_39_38]
MKLALFVHELFYEIGHSKALIEYIRHLPQDYVSELHLVVYETAEPSQLFPNFKGKVIIHKIEGNGLKPSLVRFAWYHLRSWFISKNLPNDVIKIGIGVASIAVDIVNIQFIHRQWSQRYFVQNQANIITTLYKKILFAYLNACEDFLFRKSTTRFLVIADFLKRALQKDFQIDEEKIAVAHSSADTHFFAPSPLSRENLYSEMLKSYPSLQGLELSKPIALFVGAFQRKGLPRLLKEMGQRSEQQFQLIAVGRSEKGHSLQIPPNVSVKEVSFTKELPLFYSLADAFVFPTEYEPYGLVIVEAAVMGLTVLVTQEEVGASEVLENLSGIHLFSRYAPIPLNELRCLSPEERENRRKERLEHLKKSDWTVAAKKLVQLLEK